MELWKGAKEKPRTGGDGASLVPFGGNHDGRREAPIGNLVYARRSHQKSEKEAIFGPFRRGVNGTLA